MAVKRSKSKLEVEFEYGGRLFLLKGDDDDDDDDDDELICRARHK